MSNVIKKTLLLTIQMIFIFTIFIGCGQSGANAKVAKQLELAVKYLSENKFDEAVLAYQEVIKIDPKHVVAYKGLSIAYSTQGKKEQAEQILQEGLEQTDGNELLKLTMAGLLVDLDKKDQAEAIYNEIIAQDKKYLPVYQAYSKLLISQGRQSEAVDLLEKAAATNAERYKSYSMLAEMYLKNGSKEKALAAINKSLSIEPNQSVTYQLLEELYLGELPELIALGEQYIRQNQNISGYIIKLTGLYKQGKYDDVMDIYQQLPDEVNNSAKTRLLVAQTYVKLGDKDQGISILKEIKTADIKDATLMAEIANCYLDAGDKDSARKMAFLGIRIDDTTVENYNVIYKSYLEEDKTQANIWQTKYILSSVFSLKESIEEQRVSLERKEKAGLAELKSTTEDVAEPDKPLTQLPLKKAKPLGEEDFSIGSIRIGSNKSQVIKALGYPQKEEYAMAMSSYIYLTYPGIRVELYDYDSGWVYSICFGSPNYQTMRGLKVGDGIEKVCELYGEPSNITNGDYIYDDLTSIDVDTCNGEEHITRKATFTVKNNVVSEILLKSYEW